MQFTYITSNKELDNCVNQLNRLSAYAVDLEFDKNRFAYGFNLCLVQIYTGNDCFLIDPLSKDINIQKLFPGFENSNTQKVVFAFGEDLRLLHSLGCFPKNVFDIAMAAKLLNHPPASLAALLENVLKIKVNKSSQNSNWLKRPLTEKQLDYAAQDVVHLLKLKSAIVSEAMEKNRTDWINEENAALDKLSYAGVENNNFIKKKDQNGLTEFEWYLLRELLLFREKIAEQTGRPSYQVYDKELLKKIALNPKIINEWKNKKGNYASFRRGSFIHQLEKIIEKGEKLKLSKTEKANKPLSKELAIQYRKERSEQERLKKKYLKPIQKEIAKKYGEHATTIIMGNRIIAAILAGETSQLKDYQVKIIMDTALKSGIELRPFFNNLSTNPIHTNVLKK
jgi:ribonuclease D